MREARRRRPRRLATAIALVLGPVLPLVLGGCLTDAPTPVPDATASVAPEPTPIVTDYRLDRTIWYGGFVLTFQTATASIDAKGGPVAVTLLLGNPGDDEASMDGPIALVAGDVAVEPTRDSVLPLVPGHTHETVTLVFDVDAAFDVAAAAIRVGRAEEHQAIVPLVGAAKAAVTLAPRYVDLGVTGQAGSLAIALQRVELRADLPDWRQQLAAGILAMTLTYDARYTADFSGGFPFTAANVSLRLPDGTLVEPRRDGHSQSVMVIAAGASAPGLESRFEVPAPGPGTYALIIRDGEATAELAFEILAPPGA
ncbi:MAG: hypothetical protein EPO36_05700 [Chloroflexota bacterium]|nr:MAG: hypothetical protein EPO36_05700 [Chloroflexota bacterium]